MENKHILVLFGILAVTAIFWATRPEMASESEFLETSVAPWLLPEVHHLTDHGIKIGPKPENDIRVTREGNSIRVEISEQFIAKQDATFLTQLGMLKATESMSPARYSEFLESLHMTVLTEDEKAVHEHDDSGSGGEEHSHP